MDILLTIQNTGITKFRHMVDNPPWFFTFRAKPLTNIGERMYFIHKGEVFGYGVIKNIQGPSTVRDVNGKLWNGIHLICTDFNYLKEPISFVGFMGHRYMDRYPALAEKLRKAEINAKES